MARVPIRTSYKNLQEAQRLIRAYRELAGDPTPLMETAGGILEASTRERFATGRGPGGIPWPISGRQQIAAAPGTGKRGKPTKRDPRHPMGPNQGGKPLVDKGGLLSSVTHRVEPGKVTVGVIAKTPSAKFAYVHQFGAVIKPKRGPFLIFTAPSGHKVFAKQVTIPARPFLGIDALDRADLLDAWRGQLEDMRRSGGAPA